MRFEKIQIILPLCMVIFIDAFAMSIVYPLFAPLFSLNIAAGGLFAAHISMQLKDFLYGLSLGIFAIFMFFAAPFLGDLSDQMGRKKILLLCLIGSAFAALLSGIAVLIHSFTLFFISRMLAGTMAGSLPIAQAVIIDISSEQNKTANIGLIGMAYSLGFVLGPMIGGVFSNSQTISWFGFWTPFFVTVILSLFNVFLLMLAFKETHRITKETALLGKIQLLKPLILFIEASRKPKIRNTMLTAFFYILGWNIYLPLITLYLFQQYHLSATHIGYFVSWVALMMSITMLWIIRILVRYFSNIQILCIALLISILGVLMTMIHHIILQWISAVPIACGIGLAYTTIIALFSETVEPNLQGWIMGVAASSIAAASGIAGPLLGIISINSYVAFISIIMVWVFSFFFAIRRKHVLTEKN